MPTPTQAILLARLNTPSRQPALNDLLARGAFGALVDDAAVKEIVSVYLDENPRGFPSGKIEAARSILGIEAPAPEPVYVPTAITDFEPGDKVAVRQGSDPYEIVSVTTTTEIEYVGPRGRSTASFSYEPGYFKVV